MPAEHQKTVLFVDDEPNVLSSLRRVLRREQLKVLTATSGEEALRTLEQQSVDVIVSDMRMPEMDGATLLKQVRERYPATIRMILTGYSEHESVTRAFAEADIHQLISKPWVDVELKEIIRNAIEQSERQEEESPGLQRLINAVDALPSLPAIYVAIRKELEEADDSSINRMAGVIAIDPAISAKILQISNSAFFGQRRHVDTVSRAIVVLGVQLVEHLVLATSVFYAFSANRNEGFSFEELWKHSLGCGLIARHLAEHLGRDRSCQETALLAGTLHDLGKLVFAAYDHDRYAEVLRLARERRCVVSAAESELLETTHGVVGGYLAEWWNLPAAIVEAIRWHNEPGTSKDPEFACLVHVADLLAHRLSDSPDASVAVPELAAQSYFSPADVEAIEAALDQEAMRQELAGM